MKALHGNRSRILSQRKNLIFAGAMDSQEKERHEREEGEGIEE